MTSAHLPRLIVLQVAHRKLTKERLIVFLRYLIFPRQILFVVLPKEPSNRVIVPVGGQMGTTRESDTTHLCDAFKISNSVVPISFDDDDRCILL